MKKVVFAICLLLSTMCFAQDFERGKVSGNELNESIHPLDPSANAAILYKKGKTHFDFDEEGNWVVVTEVTVRIKVYKKEGEAFAITENPFKEKDKVEFKDVAAYRIEGGKVVKKEFTNGQFNIQADKDNFNKIIFSNVNAGDVIEYHYVCKSPDIYRLPDWYFQYEVPVKNIEYSVHIPLYFVYNRLMSPYIHINETQDKAEQTHYFSSFSYRGEVTKINSALQTGKGDVTFPVAVKNYTAQNVPALNNVNFIDNINNYRSFVKHEIASLQYPGSPKKTYTTDWNTVTKSIYYEDGFGKELQREDYFAKDISLLVEQTTDRKELITKIFDYVKNRMEWNGKYGYAAGHDIATAYTEKRGNVGDINLMLIAMLRYAGYKVNPVLVSTRDHGHVGFISSNEYNYVVGALEMANGIIFLDATCKNTVPGLLPSRAINGVGRILRDNFTTAEIDLTPVSVSKESSAIIANIQPGGVVTGHVKNYYFDYSALDVREKAKLGNYENELQQKLGKLSDFTLVSNDFTKPVVEDFTFTNNRLAEEKQGKIYISPMLFYTIASNPFSEVKRTCPIDFIYPVQKKYIINIAIPEGYTVESMPQSAQYQIKDNVGGFDFKISQQQNQLQLVVFSTINYAMLGADYHPALKEFYDDVVKKEAEKIVLKKV